MGSILLRAAAAGAAAAVALAVPLAAQQQPITLRQAVSLAQQQNDLLEILEISVLSIFGGLLSPIAKDLVGSLKRVKSGG